MKPTQEQINEAATLIQTVSLAPDATAVLVAVDRVAKVIAERDELRSALARIADVHEGEIRAEWSGTSSLERNLKPVRDAHALLDGAK